MRKLILFVLLCMIICAYTANAQHNITENLVESKGEDIVVIGNAGVANKDIVITLKISAGITVKSEKLTTTKNGDCETIIPVDITKDTQVYSEPK